jgi:hypothetical protein
MASLRPPAVDLQGWILEFLPIAADEHGQRILNGKVHAARGSRQVNEKAAAVPKTVPVSAQENRVRFRLSVDANGRHTRRDRR